MNALAFTGPIPSLEEIAIPITSPVAEGPPDLIPGFLPKQGALIVAGETNIGKSLLALEVCSALTTDRPLWGEVAPNEKAKKILYVLGEHYSGVIQRLWQHTKLPMSDSVYLLGPEELGYDKWLVSSGKVNQVSVAKFQKWSEGCDLIVFDPLSAFITGVGETENDNIQMRLLLDSMSLVAQSNGASCLVLAHQGKPQMDKFGSEHKRSSYRIRGASGIEDAATNIFYLGRSEELTGKSSGNMVLTLECRKYKGQAPPEYRLMRDPNTLTHSLLGNRPFVEIMKIDTNAKVARLQADNPSIDYRTALKLVASMEGVSEDTVKRRIGLIS